MAETEELTVLARRGLIGAGSSGNSGDFAASYHTIFGNNGKLEYASSFFGVNNDVFASIYVSSILRTLIAKNGGGYELDSGTLQQVARSIQGSGRVGWHVWLSGVMASMDDDSFDVEVDPDAFFITSIISLIRNFNGGNSDQGTLMRALFDVNDLFHVTGYESSQLLYAAIMSMPQDQVPSIFNTLNNGNQVIKGKLIQVLSMMLNDTSDEAKNRITILTGSEYGEYTFNQFVSRLVDSIPDTDPGPSLLRRSAPVS